MGRCTRESFCHFAGRINEKPILKLPDFDKDFVIQTDASNEGLGAVLMQEYDGKLHTVAYGSKRLSSAESKYSTLEKECLAIVWGINKFRLFLLGKRFVLQTDHQPLAFLDSAKFRNDRVMGWSLSLQAYDFRVEDIPGKNNVMADYLIRMIM